MIEEATIVARIAALEADLLAYVAQANATVQAYNTAIGELRRLLAPAVTDYIEQPTVGSESHTE